MMADERDAFIEQQGTPKQSTPQPDRQSQVDDLEPKGDDVDKVKGGAFIRSDSSDPQEGGELTR
jgi:hypothetical protein